MELPVIETADVTVRFHLSTDRILSLKEYVTRAAAGRIRYRDFTALNKISFHVGRGETLGLIGANGAGKSTLLRVISGILKPTEGRVVCRGTVAPMLELGSGFDMELTGRENIFLNGAILGYSKEFLRKKYDDIVSFSELEDFIDTPIRNYSSGMLARLAFSVASIVAPDILIVDEILAVGDAAFQRKSKQRMLELMGGGTTVLFVSHSLADIRELCGRVLWMDQGAIRMDGTAEEVCNAYEG